MSGTTTLHKAAPLKGAALCIYSLFTGPWAAILLGLVACLSVLASLDVAEEIFWTANGPGLTFDENLNTAGGVLIVESIADAGLASLHPRTLQDIFNSPNYFPDYPPLGRMPLALSNFVLGRLCGLGDHPFYNITYARAGSAVAFGLLIALIFQFTSQHAGPLAGLIAGLSLWLTPRAFGHAHLANVETTLNLTYALCVCVCVRQLASRKEIHWKDGLLPGLTLGLALLTKMQAIFLPPVIVVWILLTWRIQGLLPLLVLTVTSAAVFIAGWPWLWSDIAGRMLEYFMQTTDRAVLYCYYFGTRYSDRDVPWHFPFVMFVITTPLPWLLLGSWGMWLTAKPPQKQGRERDATAELRTGLSPRQNRLLIGAFWLPLIIFAIPGVPVYDGERLFLMVWPIFSIWVGIAGARACAWLEEKTTAPLRAVIISVVLGLMLISQFWMHPTYLSYYAIQIGGLRGASDLGMERDYWGAANTAGFLKEGCATIPEGSRLAVAPVLHPLIPQFLKQDSWLLHRPDLEIVAYDDKQPDQPRYVLFIRRQADGWKSLVELPPGTRILKRFTKQGIVLAELLELPVSQTEADATSDRN